MKKILFLGLAFFANLSCYGQNNDTWYSFYNKDSELVGFKDKAGVIKIEPKFVGRSNRPIKFENIIYVIEENNGKSSSYFLTKSGKVIGQDMLYYFDHTPDCENENFIRFKDNKIDKTGLFDKNGNIAIPAIYNHLTKVQNSMLVALKGAKKTYQDEHYSYIGGKNLLIDTENNILIEDFTFEDQINFYSLEKSKIRSADPLRKSFLAKDGSYYSFIIYKKEFEHWFNSELLTDLTTKKLIQFSYNKIYWYDGKSSWKNPLSSEFIKKNDVVLKKRLLESQKPKADYFISMVGLNSFLHDDQSFDAYYDNCGDSKEWQYPIMNVVINHAEGKILKQNSFGFLRAPKGYRLIEVSLQTDELVD